jgi:pimeloyl-ACP methyl ester carboxylesterase
MQTLAGALGMTAQIADIERIRQILGEDKLILMGHSYGGFMAALYAFEFPGRVEKMVLISPAGTLTMPPLHGGLDRVKEYLDERGKKEYDSFIARKIQHRGPEGERGQRASGRRTGTGRRRVVGARALPFSGSELRLPRQARGDHRARARDARGKGHLPEEGSRQYADLVQGSRFVVIDEASHFAFDEAPERFAGLVSGFLKE